MPILEFSARVFLWACDLWAEGTSHRKKYNLSPSGEHDSKNVSGVSAIFSPLCSFFIKYTTYSNRDEHASASSKVIRRQESRILSSRNLPSYRDLRTPRAPFIRRIAFAEPVPRSTACAHHTTAPRATMSFTYARAYFIRKSSFLFIYRKFIVSFSRLTYERVVSLTERSSTATSNEELGHSLRVVVNSSLYLFYF